MDPRIQRSRARALEAAQALMRDGGLDAITPSRVAEHSGLGRKTIYRLWPSRAMLLHDVLSMTSSADYPVTGEPIVDIRTHLGALAAAVTDGPLGVILGALAERAPLDPELAALRSELAEEGRQPLLALLSQASASGSLPADADLATVASLLEGAVIYEALVRGRTPDSDFVDAVVAAALDLPGTTV